MSVDAIVRVIQDGSQKIEQFVRASAPLIDQITQPKLSGTLFIDFVNNLMLVETGFNLAGAIPRLGSFSGSIRSKLGSVQCLAGAVFAGFGILNPEQSDFTKRLTALGTIHFVHGTLNIVRGEFESKCGMIGRLALLVLNAPRRFSPWLTYQQV